MKKPLTILKKGDLISWSINDNVIFIATILSQIKKGDYMVYFVRHSNALFDKTIGKITFYKDEIDNIEILSK